MCKTNKRGRQMAKASDSKIFFQQMLRKTYSNLKFLLDFLLRQSKAPLTAAPSALLPSWPAPTFAPLSSSSFAFCQNSATWNFSHMCVASGGGGGVRGVGGVASGLSLNILLYTYICMCLQLAGAKPRCRRAPKIVSA